MVYRTWKRTGDIVPKGVDQPGRGPRLREPKTGDLDLLAMAMADHIAKDLERVRREHPDTAYATFGHSFGATISLTVAAHMAEPPVRQFLSAAVPPRLVVPDETAHLSDRELLEKVVKDGGTTGAVLENAELGRHLVRLMREDYAIRLQFPHQKNLKVDHPLTLIAARDDIYVPPEQMWQWAEHTTAHCRRVEIAGGHFALMQTPETALEIVAEHLRSAA
ncbi:thioesterase [Actinomadura sp. KC216]|nr:thioesterase [Actinomadura sp. KC216]